MTIVEGGPQLFLPLELLPRPPLRVLTSNGVRTPAPPTRKPKEGAPRTTPEQVEVPLFRISGIIIASREVTASSDLIEECCERGIHLSFLGRGGRPFATYIGDLTRHTDLFSMYPP